MLAINTTYPLRRLLPRTGSGTFHLGFFVSPGHTNSFHPMVGYCRLRSAASGAPGNAVPIAIQAALARDSSKRRIASEFKAPAPRPASVQAIPPAHVGTSVQQNPAPNTARISSRRTSTPSPAPRVNVSAATSHTEASGSAKLTRRSSATHPSTPAGVVSKVSGVAKKKRSKKAPAVTTTVPLVHSGSQVQGVMPSYQAILGQNASLVPKNAQSPVYYPVSGGGVSESILNHSMGGGNVSFAGTDVSAQPRYNVQSTPSYVPSSSAAGPQYTHQQFSYSHNTVPLPHHGNVYASPAANGPQTEPPRSAGRPPRHPSLPVAPTAPQLPAHPTVSRSLPIYIPTQFSPSQPVQSMYGGGSGAAGYEGHVTHTAADISNTPTEATKRGKKRGPMVRRIPSAVSPSPGSKPRPQSAPPTRPSPGSGFGTSSRRL
jgi:hypothetical protein